MIIALAVALVVVLVVALRSRRVVANTRDAAGAASSLDLPSVVARQRSRIDGLELERTEDRRDRDALFDVLAQGILSVDAGLRIMYANNAAHLLLEVPFGALVSRTVTEAFLDTQADAIARAGLETGASTGEVRLGQSNAPQAHHPGSPVGVRRRLAGPRGRLGTPPSAADPRRVHRQPVA